MLKSELEQELKQAQTVLTDQKRAFLALAEYKKRTDSEDVRKFLSDFFIWENDVPIAFDLGEVRYYLWLSEEPERKKA